MCKLYTRYMGELHVYNWGREHGYKRLAEKMGSDCYQKWIYDDHLSWINEEKGSKHLNKQNVRQLRNDNQLSECKHVA